MFVLRWLGFDVVSGSCSLMLSFCLANAHILFLAVSENRCCGRGGVSAPKKELIPHLGGYNKWHQK